MLFREFLKDNCQDHKNESLCSLAIISQLVHYCPLRASQNAL